MAAVCALAAALALIFHFASGSASSELGAHPDEAAHFVTGLMVRDYIASGLHGSPLHYADEYYKHYPKIGLGVWPPFFYVVQAAWTLIFPAKSGWVLWLMCVLGAALGAVTGWRLWREFGWAEGLGGTALLMGLPLVQQYSNMVMAEVLSALLMFGAAGCFASYLEGAEWRGALGFGLCAGLAIMTKGTGLALVFVPPLAIVLTGRFDLLRRRSLWVAALLVVVIAGPWTWHFRKEGQGGWEEPKPSLHFTQMAMGYYGRELCVAAGGMLAVLAAVGAVSIFLPKGKRPAMVVCSLALVAGVWFFQCLAPVGLEARHLTPAMPALMVLAMAGLRALAGRCCPRMGAVCVAGVCAVFFCRPLVFHRAGAEPGYGSIGNGISLSPFRVPVKQWGGFEPEAERVAADGPQTVVMVASDARGEGMFIADVAQLDERRPSFTVKRASKDLAESTWSGSGYESLYRTPEEVGDAVRKDGVKEVVTDESLAAPNEHEKLLLQWLSGAPVVVSSTAVRDGEQTGLGIKLRGVAGR